MRPLQLAVGVGLAGLLGLSGLSFLARLGDGPTGPFPGGALSGRPAAGDIDWSAVEARETVEVQVGVDDPRSVLACLFEYRGNPYLSVTLEPLKRWHHVALEERTLVLRVDDLLYERGVVPVTDPETHTALQSIAFARHQSYEFGDGWAGRNLRFLHLPARPLARR